MKMKFKNKIAVFALSLCMISVFSASAAGSATVNLYTNQNFADSAVVRRNSGESVTFSGQVFASSSKKGTFVARYQRDGSWYNDLATARKAVAPGASISTVQASTGHKFYVLRIVSGNDTVGIGNTGTRAKGTIKAQ